MAIFRVQHKKNYTTVNNFITKDSRLSYKAKGIWLYAFSRRDDWQFYSSDIEKHAKDGRDAVRSGLAELEQAGYLCRSQPKNTKGQYEETEWVFHEVPTTSDELKKKLPQTGFPSSDNRLLVSTDDTNTLPPSSSRTPSPLQASGFRESKEGKSMSGAPPRSMPPSPPAPCDLLLPSFDSRKSPCEAKPKKSSTPPSRRQPKRVAISAPLKPKEPPTEEATISAALALALDRLEATPEDAQREEKRKFLLGLPLDGGQVSTIMGKFGGLALWRLERAAKQALKQDRKDFGSYYYASLRKGGEKDISDAEAKANSEFLEKAQCIDGEICCGVERSVIRGDGIVFVPIDGGREIFFSKYEPNLKERSNSHIAALSLAEKSIPAERQGAYAGSLRSP